MELQATRNPAGPAAMTKKGEAPVNEGEPDQKKKLKEMRAEREDTMDEDTMEFVETFKEMTGWGETDPKDSSWLFMDRLDHETGKREPMGRLCVSLSLLPLSMAEVNPVGSGRSEPNTNPYLPPPTGARRSRARVANARHPTV